ncbi:hypothetical protein GH714_025598 [Hevea brasiliensis]|uniref:protein-serine/threonine phosphatase n=1 Tax=Hevea brasiliensis TaxID=3981 RepID=A0A6A6KSE4_HEVBR|nr:hypothetical protein GH714_025598 [Hevea brasiliensis]
MGQPPLAEKEKTKRWVDGGLLGGRSALEFGPEVHGGTLIEQVGGSLRSFDPMGRLCCFVTSYSQEEFWIDPNRSISKAYERTDQAILSHGSDLGRGGSTAVTAILLNGQKLWVANVGDSRAVLSRGGQAIQMSTDHEPNTERGSIEHRGGFVSNMPGDVPRVNGQLAVSRAFGDKSLKSHLRSDPDMQETIIDNNIDTLILASDGLWKVLTNQEAVDIARKIKDPLKAAKQLTAEALKRDSKDDISCVVVRFRG